MFVDEEPLIFRNSCLWTALDTPLYSTIASFAIYFAFFAGVQLSRLETAKFFHSQPESSAMDLCLILCCSDE